MAPLYRGHGPCSVVPSLLLCTIVFRLATVSGFLASEICCRRPPDRTIVYLSEHMWSSFALDCNLEGVYNEKSQGSNGPILEIALGQDLCHRLAYEIQSKYRIFLHTFQYWLFQGSYRVPQYVGKLNGYWFLLNGPCATGLLSSSCWGPCPKINHLK